MAVPKPLIYSGGEGENVYKVEVRMTDALSYDDAAVFMAFLATTAPDHRRRLYKPESELRKVLLDDCSPQEALVLGVVSNTHEIIAKLGWHRCSDSYVRLEASMKRLAGVRLFYHFRRQIWTSNLFGFRLHEDRKDFEVNINPLSSAVILGDRQSGCVMPAIHEIRELSGQTAMAAYLALVRVIKPGVRTGISLSSLLCHVYGDPTPKQREAFTKTLRELHIRLNSFGWNLQIRGRGLGARVHVTRPALADMNVLQG